MADILANYVKFLRGTPTAYNNLEQKDSDTLYFVAEKDATTGKLYLGEVLISGSTNAEGVVDYLSELKDVDTSGAVQNSVLGFDVTSQKWKVMDISSALTISVMGGASAETAGTQGLVPAPAAGEQKYFLRGDGTWAPIEIPEVSETQIFEVELIISTDGDGNKTKEEHNVAITRIVGDAILATGDIVIVKDPIVEGNFQYTAYVYNGTAWAAMDGNYNAKNVYFDQDFTFTEAIGTVTIPSSGSATVEAEGKNLYEFFASVFAKEDYPTTPTTSASITSSNIGAKEVGTNIAIAYSFNTSADAYAYGPANGVTWSDHTATFNGETKTGSSGTFTSVQVTDTTELEIVGSVEQSQGAMPVTNLGKDYPDARIPAKSWTNLKKGTLTGYRAWFCGYKNGDNALADPTAITGAEIRTLGNAANGSWKSSMSISQMKQMYFAAPAGTGYKPAVKDAATTAPQTVLGPITVYVPGANNYMAESEVANGGMAYDVWYVANADAASGSATVNITKA